MTSNKLEEFAASGWLIQLIVSQYLYRRKEESYDKNLHKTGDVLREILIGDLPNKVLKKSTFISTSSDSFSQHSA